MSAIIPTVVNEYLYYLKKGRKWDTARFKVWGNCEKCKARIEKSLKADGIKQAKWEIDSSLLEVVFNPKTISIEKIHELIAGSGHDTSELYTTDKLYRRLPRGCQYEREKKPVRRKS